MSADWMVPGSWFGWVLIGCAVASVLSLLLVLGLCRAASDGDDAVEAMFAQHEPGVASGPPALATPDDLTEFEREFEAEL